MSSSSSGMGDMACSLLPCDSEDVDVLREWARLLVVVPGCSCPLELPAA